MRKPVLLFITALALLSLVAGCASAAQKAAEQAAGVQVNQNGNQVTVKGNDGNSLTVDSSIPAELKDFPVPQGFKSDGGGTLSSDGGAMSAVSWKGTGQIQTVIDFYKNTLPGKGWKEESTVVSSDGGMLNYSRPDGYGLTVTVSADSSSKEITIGVLGGKSSKTPTPEPTATVEEAVATETPEAKSAPQATSTPAAPQTTDASAIPAELKAVPLPSGFALIKDSANRMAVGGQFAMAMGEFFGTASVKDAAAFYTSNLPAKGWNVDMETGGEGESTFVATSKSDAKLHLAVNISTDDAGTKIYLQLTKEQ